jgi:hypothetical protein
MDEIDRLLINSSKAELMELLNKVLPDYNKVLVVLIKDDTNGEFSSNTLTLGLNHSYEAYGLLEIARQDLAHDNPIINTDG